MLERKTIAKHVANLTDARYFAARGIDYLLFDLDEITVTHIFEIKEWVEGPKILLLFSSKSISFLDEAIIKIAPSGISGKKEAVCSALSHMSTHADIFSWSVEQIVLNEDTFTSITDASQLSQLRNEEGVILSGGSEDVTGMKSYDHLDAILDDLEL